ncbi:MAG: amino acid adenylation domain-containing protein [Bacteroides sp.]|nr:amino acid adenylation domain-containing protein [Bacteroides sp.]MCM1413207.1 amino acid adenylation domain-containing protein [Bacteroides sp.]MCM1472051.1 amino acid adenylation domain-containing protein [Bacteroides sp.]
MSAHTIYSKFKEMADSQPLSPAIIEEDRTTTYGELDLMVERIVTKLKDQQGKFIGIVIPHGAEQIAAMLAVLKTGAAYVPAEPLLPQDRIDYMMHTSGVSRIITQNFFLHMPEATAPLPDRSTPTAIAYILFTSGTSGKPKGVVVENHSVVNYTEAFKEEFNIGPGDIMLQYSVCSFDIFVEEVFATLLNGATLCIPPLAVHNGSIKGLMNFVDRHRVTIVDGFPYLLAEMNKLAAIPRSIRLIISGGDVIRSSYIDRLRTTGVKIYNTYGPSETTVCSNYFRVDNAQPLADGTFPIGKPIKGVEVKILDSHFHEVPGGATGEICIFGEGVGRGYLGDPPEQRNFVVMPDGHRMYRSGDLGYMLDDGNMAFLHRRDDQVMILGKRVEPEEVENVLNTCPCIERGVVKAFTDEQGLHYLTAYFVAREDCTLVKVKSWLASKLTDFMIPEFFVKMHSIPLTHRGKVDVALLPIVMKEGDV